MSIPNRDLDCCLAETIHKFSHRQLYRQAPAEPRRNLRIYADIWEEVLCEFRNPTMVRSPASKENKFR